MEEQWKDIEGYEGLYQVSNFGKIYSLTLNNIMKPYKDKKGYLSVILYKKGKKPFCAKVHRLVAKAFLSNPNNYTVVNHKDENPSNCAVWNLEYCSVSYNINYGTRNQKVSKKMTGIHNGQPIPVNQYSKDGKLIKKWNCAREAMLVGGFCDKCIRMCCTGKLKSHKGFLWEDA